MTIIQDTNALESIIQSYEIYSHEQNNIDFNSTGDVHQQLQTA